MPAAIRYQNFDLTIVPVETGYHVSITSPSGEESADLLGSDLALLVAKYGASATIPVDASREERFAALFSSIRIQDAGPLLYEWVFRDDIRVLLWRSLDQAVENAEGLRIRLRLNQAPELMNLPWEWLRDAKRDKSFALNRRTPVIRYLEKPDPVEPLSVSTPIELVAMISIPEETAKLNVRAEVEKLTLGLKPSLDDGYVHMVVTKAPTLAALRDQLAASPCHIFHFVGHGQVGALVMEDKNGDIRHVSGELLGDVLWNYDRPWDAPRLVVLNSCEGAMIAPFGGVAQELMQQGIPAVVAMRSRISDPAAISFAQGFYEAIAEGATLEAAVAQARQYMLTDGEEDEWGTPVLYTRLREARILDVEALTEEQRREREQLATLGRFWHPTDASEILVLFGKWPKVVTETGEREDAVPLVYAMLLGELKAFLARWYTDVELSEDPARDDGSRPVIALGGPLSNPVTKRVGDEGKLPVWFRGLPYTKDSERALGTDNDSFAARIGDAGEIESDVGFVARLLRDKAQPLYVIAGCYGAGTVGVVRSLMDPAQVEKLGVSEETNGVQVVARSTVRGWDAEPGELIHTRVW